MTVGYALGITNTKAPKLVPIARELFLWVERCHDYLFIIYDGSTNIQSKRELSQEIIALGSVVND